jgi:glycosyltransferase involved in cell wall biosynthesis
MNPEYVAAAGWLWYLLNKKVGLWYVHKSRTALLRFAHALVNVVFTVAEGTYPIRGSKVQITGHGIDTDLFSPRSGAGKGFRIVTAGRVSAKKNTREIVQASHALAGKHPDVSLDVYGAPVTSEEKRYADELQAWLQAENIRTVHLHGPIGHDKLPDTLAGASIFVNMGMTGGVDKAVLEAMSMGIPVISTSPAHAPLLKRYPQLVAEKSGVAEALEYVYGLSHAVRAAMGSDLRADVIEHHSLSPLIRRIVQKLSV